MSDKSYGNNRAVLRDIRVREISINEILSNYVDPPFPEIIVEF